MVQWIEFWTCKHEVLSLIPGIACSRVLSPSRLYANCHLKYSYLKHLLKDNGRAQDLEVWGPQLSSRTSCASDALILSSSVNLFHNAILCNCHPKRRFIVLWELAQCEVLSSAPRITCVWMMFWLFLINKYLFKSKIKTSSPGGSLPGLAHTLSSMSSNLRYMQWHWFFRDFFFFFWCVSAQVDGNSLTLMPKVQVSTPRTNYKP